MKIFILVFFVIVGIWVLLGEGWGLFTVIGLPIVSLWYLQYVRTRVVPPDNKLARWILDGARNNGPIRGPALFGLIFITLVFSLVSLFGFFGEPSESTDTIEYWNAENSRIETELCKSPNRYPYELIPKQICECVISKASSDGVFAKMLEFDISFEQLQDARSFIDARETNGRPLTDDEVTVVLHVERRLVNVSRQCIGEAALSAQQKAEQAIKELYEAERRRALQ